MSVWLSEMSDSATVDGETYVNIKTLVINGVTDENGEVTFDLTPYNITEIIDFDVKSVMTGVTDILSIVSASVVDISTTSIKVIGTIANSATFALATLFNAILRCDSGVNIKLVVKYR